jgi:hypothetical protein
LEAFDLPAFGFAPFACPATLWPAVFAAERLAAGRTADDVVCDVARLVAARVVLAPER